MDPISKEDLDSDVVRAVIEHYRTADSKVRVASLHGALFVLKWQWAKKFSGDALARIAAEGVRRLSKEIKSAEDRRQADQQKEVWTVLERLIAAADQPDGGLDEKRRAAWDAAMADARALLARKRLLK